MVRFIILLIAIRPFVDPLYNVVLWKIGSYDVNPLTIWAVLLILSCVVYWLSDKDNPLAYHGTIWILFFILSLFTGAVVSNNFEAPLTVGTKVLPWLLLIPTSASIATSFGKERIATPIFLATCTFTLFNFVLLVTGNYESNYYRIGEFYGLYKIPHGLSFMYALMLPFVLYRVYSQEQKSLLATAILFTSVLFVSLTFVRSGILAVIIGLGVFFGSNRKRFFFALTISLCVVGLAVIFFGDPVGGVVASRTKDFSDVASGGRIESMGSSRWGFWTASLLHLSSVSPFAILFGGGYGYLQEYLASSIGMSVWAHNDYIDLLFTNGLISLVLFLKLQHELLRASFRLLGSENRLIGSLGLTSLTIAVVVGITNGNLYGQSNTYFACMMGIVIAELRAGPVNPA